MIHHLANINRAHSLRRAKTVFSVILVFSLCLFYALAVHADDDDDDPAPQQQAQARAAAPNQVVLTPETIDQWIFGGVIMRDPTNTSARQMDLRCQSLIDMRIDAVDRICHLTDAQKAKLRLAASGDVKKFRDSYLQLSSKYVNTKRDPNDVNEVFALIQPLRTQWQTGILGDQSLFQRVIPATLQPQQVTAFQEEETSRNKIRYQAKVKLAITSLDNTLALTDKQRTAFEQLLLNTPPPKIFGQMDYYYVLTQLSKLPEEKLKPIFDARQWKIIQQAVQRGRAFQNMLVQQGVM
jgi:hypothetical protein